MIVTYRKEGSAWMIVTYRKGVLEWLTHTELISIYSTIDILKMGGNIRARVDPEKSKLLVTPKS